MKNQVHMTVLFGAVIALVSGITGAYAGNYAFTDANDPSVLGQTGLMTGHVAITHTDGDGNIKAYRQTDNIITDTGEGCALKLLFGGDGAQVDASSTDICGPDAVAAGSFNFIAIGNFSSLATAPADVALATDTELFTEHNQTGTGFERAQDTTVVITHTGGSSGSAVLSNTFTLDANLLDDAGQSLVVSESGLFNSTLVTTTGMFARQTFAGVTVDDGEALTVEWTINIGGTALGSLGAAEET